MIVDTHVHAIEPATPERPHDPSRPAHGLPVEDLLRDMDEAGVDKAVQVVPAAMFYDNTYGFECADRFPDRFAGVILRFDPFARGVEERLREAMRHPKAIGVRFNLVSSATAKAFEEGKLDAFFALAEQTATTIQLFAPYAVSATLELVRRYPAVRWLIDHMGLRYYAGKDNRDAFRQWPELIVLAAEPNVWIKCSYFPEAALDIEPYPYPVAQERFRELYERVGAARLVWGSNYPNVRRACTYRQAVDFVRDGCTFFTPADRAAVLGANFLRDFAR